MMSAAATWRFRRDPLRFIESAARVHGTVFRLPGDGTLCIADPSAALNVLRDRDRYYGETSGFFRTRTGGPWPRPVQIAVGQAARDTLHAHLVAHVHRLADLVAELGTVSAWPAAGRALVFRFWIGALLHTGSSPALRRLLAEVIRRNVLIRSAHPAARLSQALFRTRVMAAVTDEVRSRRTIMQHGHWRQGGGTPRDLLGAVIEAVPQDTAGEDIAEAYMMLLRTSVAPVAHTVGWALLLATDQDVDLADHPPAWSIWESLRLWPSALLLGRSVQRAHQVAGVPLEPGDAVAVCVYLLQRDEHLWPRADSFRPQRWAPGSHRGPYLPFGYGPFACAGTAIARSLATELLTALVHGAHLAIQGGHRRSDVQGIISPPPFVLHRDTD